MNMDRAEQTGFGASVAGHLLLVGLLASGYLAVRPLPMPKRQSIEVDLVAETAMESGAPEISNEAPAPKLSEIEAPIEPEPLAKPVIEPVPAPKPLPDPRPVARQPTKPAPKSSSARPSRSQRGFRDAVSNLPDDGGRATAPPAAAITAAVQQSLLNAVLARLRRTWDPPTGADANLLKTKVRFRLARDGSLTAVEADNPTGVTPTNRAQAALHRERAERAVRLAAPFKDLPAKYYAGPDGWNSMEIDFDVRLR